MVSLTGSLIKRIEPGTVLGELPAFGLSMFGAVIEAATAARVVAIDKDGFAETQGNQI
jgi:CRP-like cAMP-binding protein